MLQPYDRLPHFEVATLDGGRFRYRDIWQRRNLLWIVVPPDAVTPEAAAALRAQVHRAAVKDTAVVMSGESIHELGPGPVAVLADRWGEVQQVIRPGPGDALSGADLAAWLEFLQSRCPECEGESR